MHFRCIPLYLVYLNGICTSLNKWALNINKLFIIQEEFKSIHWIILNNKYNKDLVSGCNISIIFSVLYYFLQFFIIFILIY